MTRYNPNGMVIMNARAPKLSWTTEHSQHANYLTHTFLDQNREAGDFQRATNMPYTVSRLYPFEPHANTEDREKIKQYAHDRFDDIRRLRADAANRNVLFQINNEQGFRKDDMLMYKYMVERSIELNDIIGMVFWNGASGTVKTGFWGQPNQWREPWALELIETLHRYREKRLPNGAYAYVLGVHSYTSQYPLIAVNAGRDRLHSAHFQQRGFKNLRNSHDAYLRGELWIDWSKPQDHLARNYQGIMKALGWIPSIDGRVYVPGPTVARDDEGQAIRCPWILNTEQLFDNMNDVRHVHWDDLVRMTVDDDLEDWERESYDYALELGLPDQTLQFRKLKSDEQLMAEFEAQDVHLDTPRGYRSLEKTWAKDDWFPGMSPGEVLAYCNDFIFRVIYQQTGVHIGGHNYCLGDTSGPNFWWISFNLWDTERGHPPAEDYFKAMEKPEYQLAIAPHFLGEAIDEPPAPPVPDPEPPADNTGVLEARIQTLEQRVSVLEDRNKRLTATMLGVMQAVGTFINQDSIENILKAG